MLGIELYAALEGGSMIYRINLHSNILTLLDFSVHFTKAGRINTDADKGHPAFFCVQDPQHTISIGASHHIYLYNKPARGLLGMTELSTNGIDCLIKQQLRPNTMKSACRKQSFRRILALAYRFEHTA